MNDFVNGVDFFSGEGTAHALPLEFYVFGISKETYEPWTVVDTLSLGKLMSFNLATWYG